MKRIALYALSLALAIACVATLAHARLQKGMIFDETVTFAADGSVDGLHIGAAKTTAHHKHYALISKAGHLNSVSCRLIDETGTIDSWDMIVLASNAQVFPASSATAQAVRLGYATGISSNSTHVITIDTDFVSLTTAAAATGQTFTGDHHGVIVTDALGVAIEITGVADEQATAECTFRGRAWPTKTPTAGPTD